MTTYVHTGDHLQLSKYVKCFFHARRVKSSPDCSCALLSSASRTNYVGM